MTSAISLRLFATLAKYMPEDTDRYPIASGTTVRDVVDRLGIREAEARLIFINNKRALLTSVLNDGDRLGIFPPIGGG